MQKVGVYKEYIRFLDWIVQCTVSDLLQQNFDESLFKANCLQAGHAYAYQMENWPTKATAE